MIRSTICLAVIFGGVVIAAAAMAVDGVSAPTASGTGNIGALKRDESGRIVRVPQQSDQAGEAVGLPGRVGGVRRGSDGTLEAVPGSAPRSPSPGYSPGGFNVRSYVDHDSIARERQRTIDGIVREERRRKRDGAPVDGRGFTARENALIDQLAEIDREVIDHENQHYYSGRPYTGQPEYWYVVGPDNRRYVVTGVTPIDTSQLADSQAMLDKLLVLKRSALAPSRPSDVDRRSAERIDEMIRTLKASMAGTAGR